jgi:hypothetical protein
LAFLVSGFVLGVAGQQGKQGEARRGRQVQDGPETLYVATAVLVLAVRNSCMASTPYSWPRYLAVSLRGVKSRKKRRTTLQVYERRGGACLWFLPNEPLR